MKVIDCNGNNYIVSEKHSISHDQSGVNWDKCDLKIGIFNWCEVYYCQINTNIYIKPIERVFDANFESIFDFGISCQNYNDKKVVWLKNANLH